MKGVKLTDSSKQRKSIYLNSSSNITSKRPLHTKLSPRAIANGHNKENLDSKTSTQDRTHKLDTSQLRLKDVSNIVSKSLLCEEQSLENTFSAISLINILDEANSRHLNQELLNFETFEDNEALKQELEMKNRLIERLMKENTAIRGETETVLSTIEQVKERLNTDTQDYNSKIIELEYQIVQLEAANKFLKEQVRQSKDSNNKYESEKVRHLEEQALYYCKSAKNDMEEFHSTLNEQLKSFMNISRFQYQSFTKIVQDCIDEIKQDYVVDSKNHPQDSKTRGTLLSPHNNHKKNGFSLDQVFTTESSITQSITSLSSSKHGDNDTKSNLFLRRNLTEFSSNPKILTNICEKIDEYPEFSSTKNKCTFPFKTYRQSNNIRKAEGFDKPLVKKKTTRLSLGSICLSKSASKNRVSLGLLSNDKKLIK